MIVLSSKIALTHYFVLLYGDKSVNPGLVVDSQKGRDEKQAP